MQVGRSEAAAIYARACCAWYGAKALKIAQESIRRCRRREDATGVEIWTEIARLISEMKARNPRRAIARGRLY